MLERLLHRELARRGRARLELLYLAALNAAPHYGLTLEEAGELADRMVEMYASNDHLFVVDVEGEMRGVKLGEIRYRKDV